MAFKEFSHSICVDIDTSEFLFIYISGIDTLNLFTECDDLMPVIQTEARRLLWVQGQHGRHRSGLPGYSVGLNFKNKSVYYITNNFCELV